MTEDGKYYIEQYMRNTDFINWDWQSLVNLFEPIFQKNGFREKSSDGQRHLLLLMLNAMGDMVLATGFVREVRRNNPNDYITLLVSSAIYPLVYKCPYVNQVLVLNVGAFYNDKQKFFAELLQLCTEKFWKERYDMSICPQWGDDKTVTQVVAYMSGAVRRVGYSCNIAFVYGWPLVDDTQEKALMTDVYIIPAEIVHEAERAFYLLELLEMTVEDRRMEIWLGKRDKIAAEKLLADAVGEGHVLIAVGLGAGGDSRKYPVKQYAEVCRALFHKLDAYFVILGGKSEQQDALYLQSQLPADSVCNLAGKTTVLETAAVLSMTNIYLGNDTGVMHMAAAEAIPVVMISREEDNFSGRLAGILSENQRFAPWQTNYVICCPDNRLGDCASWYGYGGCKELYSHCICQVKPEEIVNAVEILLQ